MRSPSTVKNAPIQQKFCLINCAPVGSVEGMQRSSSVEGMQRSSQRTGMTLTTVSATPAWRSGTKQVEHPEPGSPRTERPPRSRATTTRRHLSTLKRYFVSLSSRALVHTSPPTLAAPGCAVPSAANTHRSRDVHCKLGSKEQWEPCCKNFNGPVVMRRHDHVHVTMSCVAPHCRTRLSANPGHRPLWSQCPRFESSGNEHAQLCASLVGPRRPRIRRALLRLAGTIGAKINV